MSSSLEYRSPIHWQTAPRSRRATTCAESPLRTVCIGMLTSSLQVALEYDVDYSDCIGFVRDARAKGLKAPVILMGGPAISMPSTKYTWN